MRMRFDHIVGRPEKRRVIKISLIVAAVVIAAGSLTISQSLINDLKVEEQRKMETWAEAMRALIRADETTDLNLVLKVINANHTIPVILTDDSGNVMDYRNIALPDRVDSLKILRADAADMRTSGRVMYVQLSSTAPTAGRFAICYGESLMLKRLTAFPYVQLGVVGLFIAIALFALLSSKRAEQNKVWVGLSRETAHQLGTPISSLMAWTEMLQESYPDDPIVRDMTLDVDRLQLIAERFSKIGSTPSLQPADLGAVIGRALAYMSRRASGHIHIWLSADAEHVTAKVNAPLFEWVIENLCKNAIDAMGGAGSITVTIRRRDRQAVIEVTDTGRGIPKSHFKAVFRPGFTTKKRGWGLGLSLAKRIIEEYHGGSIFVKQSEPNVGTTFCILLPL